ncbi:hypothetical protein TNCV_3352781 [Trichonephila clavipes]|nr:hypothetical protein TNCV_3352781 [Trichonephila clavipes]
MGMPAQVSSSLLDHGSKLRADTSLRGHVTVHDVVSGSSTIVIHTSFLPAQSVDLISIPDGHSGSNNDPTRRIAAT